MRLTEHIPVLSQRVHVECAVVFLRCDRFGQGNYCDSNQGDFNPLAVPGIGHALQFSRGFWWRAGCYQCDYIADDMCDALGARTPDPFLAWALCVLCARTCMHACACIP